MPEEDAPIVLKKMARVKVGNRPVVVDAADRVNPEGGEEKTRGRKRKPAREEYAGRRSERKAPRGERRKSSKPHEDTQSDWRQFFNNDNKK